MQELPYLCAVFCEIKRNHATRYPKVRQSTHTASVAQPTQMQSMLAMHTSMPKRCLGQSKIPLAQTHYSQGQQSMLRMRQMRQSLRQRMLFAQQNNRQAWHTLIFAQRTTQTARIFST
jgi:hypothetical protein